MNPDLHGHDFPKEGKSEMRRVEYKWECMHCRMIITTSSSFHPDKKAGGPCPKNPRGEHSWMSRGRTEV